jgi:molybdopterin biosynthesis enzyme
MRGVLERVGGSALRDDCGFGVEQGAPAYTVRLSGRQSSAMLTSMHRANCLIALPEGLSSVAAGSAVECIRLDQEEGTP